MDISIVKELVAIMEASTLTSMEVELSGQRVKLGREVKWVQSEMQAPAHIEVKTQSVLEAPAKETAAPKEEKSEAAAPAASGQKQVVAPMVGIFRLLESVGKGDPVVKGTELKKGQTVCLIEAMKLLIEIEMEEDGVILERLVEDGEMVEYGQPLYTYK